MAETRNETPDLRAGVPSRDIRDGHLFGGRVGDDDVVLTRVDGEVVAFGGTCPHLGAPLAKGLCSGAILQCPWHHARFDLRTGEAIAAPAFDALQRWIVTTVEERVVVIGRAPASVSGTPRVASDRPGIVIVGGGAAAYAAAHELRRRGHEGLITMVSSDDTAPYDRTLLSKDYLDGKFGDDRLPIARKSLDDLGVRLLAGVAAGSLDTGAHIIRLSDGRTLAYSKLLLATGAEPKRLDVPGADLPHVHVLRSLADCRAILAALRPAAKVVVVGSSFIGLEAAASIRSRDFAVTVVTPETAPMDRILGAELSRAIVGKHTGEGVLFRMGAEVTAITPDFVELRDGNRLPADLVIVGIGVTPRLDLARAAGLWVEDGVMVDTLLQTSDPDVFAAGDIARWPDVRSDGPIRVEHWVVAERQGEVAAANMLGAEQPYTDVPFFWSKHFDLSFRYVGHAESWDDIAVDGDPAAGRAVLHYRKGGRDLAVVTVGDDMAALEAGMALERQTGPSG